MRRLSYNRKDEKMAKKKVSRVGIGGSYTAQNNNKKGAKPPKDKTKILLLAAVIVAVCSILALVLVLSLGGNREPDDKATLQGVRENRNELIFVMSDGTEVNAGALPDNHEGIKIRDAIMDNNDATPSGKNTVRIVCTDENNAEYTIRWNIKKFGEGYSLKNAWINSEGYLIFEIKIDGELQQVKQGQILKLTTPEKEMTPSGGSEYYDPENLPADYALVDIKVKGYGTVTILVDKTAAPETAAAFLALARDGYYNGLTFNKIFDAEKYGDPASYVLGGISKASAPEIQNEFSSGISHKYGTISMYHKDGERATAQFFISTGDNSAELDGKYASFGYVISGMNIVEKIAELTGTFSEPDGVMDDQLPTYRAKQAVIESVTVRTV